MSFKPADIDSEQYRASFEPADIACSEYDYLSEVPEGIDRSRQNEGFFERANMARSEHSQSLSLGSNDSNV